MQLVRFTRDMRPQTAGSERVIPDDVAQRLAAEGAVTIISRWPADAPAPEPAQRPLFSLPRHKHQQKRR